MPQVPVYNMAGEQIDTIDLNERIFGAPMKEAAVHQAAVRQLANLRQGTASTKTRAKVSGGGAKREPAGRARAAPARRSGAMAASSSGHTRATMARRCRAKPAGPPFARC